MELLELLDLSRKRQVSMPSLSIFDYIYFCCWSLSFTAGKEIKEGMQEKLES